MTRSFLVAFAAVTGSIVLTFGSAQAQPMRAGSLDPSFGRDGKATTSFGSSLLTEAHAVLVLPDGRIVAVGSRSTPQQTASRFALARYKPDGSLDRSFGTGGKVTVGSGNISAHAAALASNGTIVAAGGDYGGGTFELARFRPDGSLDSGFGDGGWVRTSFGGAATGTAAHAVGLQPGGKIVAAGAAVSTGDSDFALARYNSDGSLDTSFDGDGKVTTSLGPGYDFVSGLAVQPDGKLVVAGSSRTGSDFNNSSWDFALARYNPDGSLDTTFGLGGKVTTAIGSDDDQARDVVLQKDGKLVAAGYASDGGFHTFDFALVRYSADGSLDTSFGGTGEVRTNFGPAGDDAYALVLQPDGKLVAAGFTDTGFSGEIALARYRPNGSLDLGFHGDGKLMTAIGSDTAVAYALARQPDGKLVVAGSNWHGAGPMGDFALVRYLSGKERCVVPDVTGKTRAQAKRALTRAYCSVGRIKRAYSNTVGKGRVISQRPSAGAKRTAGAKINLVVSKGRR